jgi:hypothetical protein
VHACGYYAFVGCINHIIWDAREKKKDSALDNWLWVRSPIVIKVGAQFCVGMDVCFRHADTCLDNVLKEIPEG